MSKKSDQGSGQGAGGRAIEQKRAGLIEEVVNGLLRVLVGPMSAQEPAGVPGSDMVQYSFALPRAACDKPFTEGELAQIQSNLYTMSEMVMEDIPPLGEPGEMLRVKQDTARQRLIVQVAPHFLMLLQNCNIDMMIPVRSSGRDIN